MHELSNREKLLIDLYLEEDSGRGDPSSVPLSGIRSTASIRSESDCVLSGAEAVVHLFLHLGCEAVASRNSGDEVSIGEELFMVKGPAPALLRGERIALNILSRMSSIATYARRIAKTVHATGSACRIAGTRKTTPGFTYFEKRALIDGGALPHRFTLTEFPMIKDNHLKLMAGAGIRLSDAVASIREASAPNAPLEVEAEDERTALEALDAGAQIIMLDNRTPDEFARLARNIRDRAKKRGVSIIIEASGGITEESVLDYVPNADVISMSVLTRPPVFIGFKMDVF
jgi:nicotinate-nucleotide pyrophosphorylase (carboxylating)